MERDAIIVLHVDDDAPIRDLTKDCLEDCNSRLTIVSVPSAAEGLEQLEERPIDCIVSDYDMPETDGLGFLKAVRSEHPALPFIMYTGKGSEEVAARAINNGADAYYQKEVGTAQYTVLAKQITTLVEKYYAERRLISLEREKHITDGGVSLADEICLAEHDESTSIAVVKAVAAHEGIDPVALTPPLSEIIDPEALDTLFPPQSKESNKGAKSLTFTYLGYRITISNDNQIEIDE